STTHGTRGRNVSNPWSEGSFTVLLPSPFTPLLRRLRSAAPHARARRGPLPPPLSPPASDDMHQHRRADRRPGADGLLHCAPSPTRWPPLQAPLWLAPASFPGRNSGKPEANAGVGDEVEPRRAPVAV